MKTVFNNFPHMPEAPYPAYPQAESQTAPPNHSMFFDSFVQESIRFRHIAEMDQTQTRPITQHPFICQLISVLDQKFSQANFTVEQLARAMSVCPRTLHRKTIGLTTLNPTKLIRLYRLSKAVEFLQQGYLVSDTAIAVGFDNLSYFTKCFTKEFKVYPSHYLTKKDDVLESDISHI